jgi:hypothetical protein
MKKLFSIIILAMIALAVNAQRTPVKVSELNKAIIDNVAANYAGFTVKDATKVMTNNVTEYEVAISKGTTQETLLYDKDGKFIKKVIAKGGTMKGTAKKNPGSPAHKKTPVKPTGK